MFHIPEKETADKWDGHTPQEAAERLHKFLLEMQDSMPIAWRDIREDKQKEYLPKGKIYHIMRELSMLSLSDIIPIESEEYKKIDEITSDVRDLLDYPIVKKENLKEDRWHKVKESLPDNGRLVLANDCLGNTLLARYDGEGNWEVSVYDNDDYYCQNTITKWCEIPSEVQNEQKPRKFKLGDKIHWHDDDTNVITITGFRDDAYLTDSAYGPILFCDEDNWERIERKQCIYGDIPSVERCAVCSAKCDIRVREDKQKPEAKLTGWVARDREFNPYYGTGLILFREKPSKSYDCWNGDIASHLPWKLFPDLKWEDEPMEIEITIRKK